MTKIVLNGGYYVEQDRLNYILRQDYISDKNGKPATKTIGYFNNMRHLIDKYLEQYQKTYGDREDMEMREYVKMIEESNKQAVSGLNEALRAFPIK